MDIIVVGIIALFTLLNVSSYFVMQQHAPVYTVFTGAVHYPIDYLYYLTFITQGSSHWLLSAHLSTGETTGLHLFNWLYVLGGHIGYFFRLNAPVIYQILVIITTILYLTLSYRLTTLLWPKNRTARMITYLFFLLSNAFPNIHMDSGAWVISYYHPWNSMGDAFIRLTNVPHHLFIQSMIMAGIIIAVSYWQRARKMSLLYLAVSGLLLASMQPLQWAFVGSILGLSGIYIWWVTYRGKPHHHWIKEASFAFLPAIMWSIAGTPMTLYLKHLYGAHPFDYTLLWEATQQVRLTFIDFIILNGPLMLLGILGLPGILKRMTVASFPVIASSVLAYTVFFSPIPEYLGILNLRFISVIGALSIAYISTDLLLVLSKKITPPSAKAMLSFFAILVISITIPVTINQLIERTGTSPDDVNTFLPLGAYQTYKVAQKTVGPGDTVLVSPLFTSSFPAFTGKHAFAVHPLSTIDFDRKIREEIAFLDGKDTDDNRTAWLKKNNIAYIFTNAWTPLYLPGLSIIYQNLYAILYQVN